MAAPTLLTIHPEIREVIYTIYLTSPNPLPPSSITRANRLSRRTHRTFPAELDSTTYFSDYCNYYPDPTINPAKPASLSLLLCNRQIYTEVSSTITFLTAHSKQLQYEIDCEIVDELELYPTWLHIPIHFKEDPIPCLYATFRISGKLDRGGNDRGRSGWDHGCGGPGPMVWSLMSLLNRFLKIGPNFIGPRLETPPSSATAFIDQSSRGEGKVKTLINRFFNGGRADIQSSAVASSSTTTRISHNASNIKVEKLILDFAPSPLAPEEVDRRRDAGEIIDPMHLAKFLKEELNYLFGGSEYTIGYGSFIASRVGIVHLRCAGEDLAEWNLAGTEVLHHIRDTPTKLHT